MKKVAPIVIVYLNDFLPKYALENIKYMEQTFKERDIFILVSEEKYNSKKYNLRRSKIIVLGDFESDLVELRGLTTHAQEFRKDFWNLTIARFFALEKFMLNSGVESIFHFEADVLIAPYFPFGNLERIQNKIAFPKVSSIAAAASVFYVDGVENLCEMNRYFKESLRRNSLMTDMTLLSNFSSDCPTLYYALYSGIEPDTSKPRELFDAATFGIYLTGGDPKNARGWTKFFIDVNDHTAKPSNFEYSITCNNVLLAKYRDLDFEIQNLHIHSKNRKYFSGSWPNQKLKLQISKSKTAKRSEFSLEAFYFLAKGYLIRRLLRMLRL